MSDGLKLQVKYFFLIGLVIALDQWSKQWVMTHYMPYDPSAIFPFFNITLAFNSGAAFSLLAGGARWHSWFFVVFASSVSLYLFFWLSKLKPSEWPCGIALSLIIAGALSNLWDRVTLGQVIDFIDIYYHSYHWPIFNVADSAICLGATWLFFAWKK